MCFISILLLRKMVDLDTIVGVLKSLGYTVEIRESGGGSIVEARRGRARMWSTLDRSILKIETEDYGLDCLRDLDEIYRALYEEDLKPEVVEVISPYIYVYEKRRRRAKKLFEKVGIEVEELYSGYCG